MLTLPEQLLAPGITLRLLKYQNGCPSSWRKSQPDSLHSNLTFEFHLQ